MTDTMLAANAKLYAKMEESFQDFSNWLLKQQPEEILNHAYEYATKADILAIMETTDLDEAQANALLTLDDPLDAVFKEFGDSSSNSMDVLVSFIEDKADELVSLRSRKDLVNSCVQTTLLAESGHYAYSNKDTALLQNGLTELLLKI